jgi:hypothetical protein
MIRLGLSYLNGLFWALSFTSHAIYAIGFSYRVGLLFRGWMTRRIQPIKYPYRTDIYASTITCTNVEVYCYYIAMYSQYFGWIDWTPNIVTFMLAF